MASNGCYGVNSAGVTVTCETHNALAVTFTSGAGNTFNPATQVLNIDSSGGVSTDANNILTDGADGLPWLSCEEIQDCIGTAIAAGLGLTYNDVLNAITGALAIPVTSGTGAPAATANSPTVYRNTSTGDVYYRDTTGNVILINSGNAITPLAVTDSSTIDFTASGTLNHTLTGSIINDPNGGLTSTAAGEKVLLDPASTVIASTGAAGLLLELPDIQTRSSEKQVYILPLPAANTALGSLPTPCIIDFTLSKARRVRIDYTMNGNVGTTVIVPLANKFLAELAQVYVDGFPMAFTINRSEVVSDGAGRESSYFVGGFMHIDLAAGAHTAQILWGQDSDDYSVFNQTECIAHIAASWVAYANETGEIGTTATGNGAQTTLNY